MPIIERNQTYDNLVLATGHDMLGMSHSLITDKLVSERTELTGELDDLLKNVEHIKEIVSVQQSMAKSSGVNQELCPYEILELLTTATKGLFKCSGAHPIA